MPLKWYRARSRNRTIVILGDHGEIVVTDARTSDALLLAPQREPTRVLGLNSDISVLFLEQRCQAGNHLVEDDVAIGSREAGISKTVAWLLIDGCRSSVTSEQISNSSDFPEIRKAFTKALLDEALRLLTIETEISPEPSLRPGEREALNRLFASLDTKAVVAFKPLRGFVDNGELSSATLDSAAQVFRNFGQGLVSPTMVPADLLNGMAVTHMRHIPLGIFHRESAHLCWTSVSTCPFLLVSTFRSKKKKKEWCQGFIFAPDRQVIFGDSPPEEAAAFLDRALASLFLAILSSNGHPLKQPYQSPDRGGLLLLGHKNLGHGIWDELQAIERALQFKSRWNALPVFYVHTEGGAALYRPLEDLYPELEGRFIYLDTIQDIVDHAFTHGIQLFRGKGRLAMRATRDRLTRVAQRHGDIHALAAGADKFLKNRPVLVYGLRMSNRHPVDALGFYVRLTEALLNRFERLSVIFDGMNVDPRTGGPVAPIVNGNSASDERRQLDLEMAFVEQFRATFSSLPVQVQSCVGLPLRDNLFWLSQSDFFVSPNGGGLAKLRWALDIPGYVLTSKVNFAYCTLVNAYGDNTKTEAPFSPIYMNTPDEVEDVPIQPPRAKPLKPRAIPYPENFNIAEVSVIPRICELVQLSLDQRG